MDKIKILAIVGSLRKDSFNKQLALIAKEVIGDRAEFNILDYHNIPMMNEDIERPEPESIRRVRDEVRACDAIWFFTPEYNHFFSGVLKNLLDWLSRQIDEEQPPLLAKKPAAVSGITPGMFGTVLSQDHLVTLLSWLDMDIMNTPRLTIPHALTQLDEEGKLILQKSRKYLERQADAFLNFIQNRMQNK
ncbi:MAG TPA: NAD(P)H-dependent oxidoreductase [Clostridiales bacterium]|jgi:chromate reductase|nr:NAD(P)H-dependent oxidoreductase [Clostridiales bacterium]